MTCRLHRQSVRIFLCFKTTMQDKGTCIECQHRLKVRVVKQCCVEKVIAPSPPPPTQILCRLSSWLVAQSIYSVLYQHTELFYRKQSRRCLGYLASLDCPICLCFEIDYSFQNTRALVLCYLCCCTLYRNAFTLTTNIMWFCLL